MKRISSACQPVDGGFGDGVSLASDLAEAVGDRQLKRGGYGGVTSGFAEVAGGLSGEACDGFMVLKDGFGVLGLIFEERDDGEAHHAVGKMAEFFEGFAGGAARALEKHHGVVSDLEGRGADGVQSVADEEC